jgi:hypothetical protein
MEAKMRYATIKMAFFAAALFLLPSCTQWKKLTGTDNDTDNANISGVWNGTVQLDSKSQNVTAIISQNRSSLSGTLSIRESTLNVHGQIFGNVSGNGFSMVIDEGSACTNKITMAGETRDGLLIYRIVGAGNDLPSFTCYPDPIDIIGSLAR